jgi:uncharacterized membrane protein
MLSRAELKARARQQIKGNIFGLFLAYLVISITTSIASFVTFGVGAILITGPLMLGLFMMYYNLAASGVKPDVGNVFKGFTDGNFLRGFLGYILMQIFIVLWSLLFIIPGLIKSLAYSQTFFILAENGSISGNDAITTSRRLMDGHKVEYFVLGLSFIPWILLIMITFGIAAIWVTPYMQTTLANYYLALRGGAGQAAAQPVATPTAPNVVVQPVVQQPAAAPERPVRPAQPAAPIV